jgi:hypothetical protein
LNDGALSLVAGCILLNHLSLIHGKLGFLLFDFYLLFLVIVGFGFYLLVVSKVLFVLIEDILIVVDVNGLLLLEPPTDILIKQVFLLATIDDEDILSRSWSDLVVEQIFLHILAGLIFLRIHFLDDHPILGSHLLIMVQLTEFVVSMIHAAHVHTSYVHSGTHADLTLYGIFHIV